MKQSINYIHHLNDFYSALQEDDRLHANHISLYHALFRIWSKHEFENPVQIKKEDVLRLCRIGSKTTYTKCLRELHELKYIIYQPSKVPYIPSAITMLPLDRNVAHNPDQIYSSTYTEISPHTRSNYDTPDDPIVGRYVSQQINSDKTGSETGHVHPKMVIPDIREVITFFLAAGQSRVDANKFFYHNQAVGWLLGGDPILDWKAAANKWIQNTSSMPSDRIAKSPINGSQQSQITTTKDYNIPF